MGHGKLFTESFHTAKVQRYRLPSKSIRLFPVEIRKPNGKQNFAVSSFSFMYGSTNLNEKVSIVPSVPLASSGQLIHRKNYIFLGGCSLKARSRKILSPPNPPPAPHTSSFLQPTTGTKTFPRSNDPSKSDEHQNDCNDDTDFNSSDLVVGLGIELDAETTGMCCHFDNNPEDRKDRSVMIALKFNDIRAVIQAHGHLDGCSQFVKVDLGIGDRGGDASTAVGAARGKRFSCVLTSTFPCRPTHPSQCVVAGRLCSITEFESAILDYYSSSTSTSSSSSCQRGIAEKSDKESGKLKFLQGHIFVSICAGDYDLVELERRQNVRLVAAADDGITGFERRLLQAEKCEGKEENVIFMVSTNEEKFHCDLATIKSKSHVLAEVIEMHGEPSTLGGPDTREFSMGELTSEAVTALIRYLKSVPLKEYGFTIINCHTAISLIETGRKYKIKSLERYICRLIIGEQDHLWFDIESLVKLFQLYSADGSRDAQKVRFKVLQAFRMKRPEDDKDGLVEQLFHEDPMTAGELLMGALTLCSKSYSL